MLTSKSIVSPEDQKVTFVELFFDLVFVYSVTQVVGLFHGHLDWVTVGKAVLIFWLVWWAWTQYTWSLNAVDTNHPLIQLAVLAATGMAFFMAVALPQAFGDQSAWFGIAYVIVRLLGLLLQFWVSSADPDQRKAVRSFAGVSIAGLVAVLIGALIGGTAQLWLWGLAIALDVLATAVGGQFESWNLHPEHFSERHGLFIIIALGEGLIVAAGGVTGSIGTQGILLIAILAVAITGTLWWSYFPRTNPLLEHALETAQGTEQVQLARDVFSLLHFPMVSGIVAYAVAIEEVVAHPAEPLELAGRIALAAGILLFVGGKAAAVYRATGRVLWARVILVLVTAAGITAMGEVGPAVTFGIALTGMIAVLLIEQRTIPTVHEMQP